MENEEAERIKEAPLWLAPLGTLLFLTGLSWLLYPRFDPVRKTLDLLLLQSEAARRWLFMIALLPLLAFLVMSVAARAWPRLTQGVERRTYAFLASSEALPWLLALSLGWALLLVEARYDAWIQSRHGLDFTTLVFRVEGTLSGQLQSWMRPNSFGGVTDPLFAAALAYGTLSLGVGVPLWQGWRRDEAALRGSSLGLLVLAGFSLPWFALLSVQPPSVALAHVDEPARSIPLLHQFAPSLADGFPTPNGNAFPNLSAALAGLVTAVPAFLGRWRDAAGFAVPSTIVALAPLYLGEAWLVPWTASVLVGVGAAWVALPRPRA